MHDIVYRHIWSYNAKVVSSNFSASYKIVIYSCRPRFSQGACAAAASGTQVSLHLGDSRPKRGGYE